MDQLVECKFIKNKRLQKFVWQNLPILNICIPYDPAITIRGTNLSKRYESNVNQKTFTMFMDMI